MKFNSPKEFPRLPEEDFQGAVYAFIDLGTQGTDYPKHQVAILLDLDYVLRNEEGENVNKDGSNATTSMWVTRSLHEKANMRTRFLNPVINFKEADIETFDATKLLGQSVTVVLEEKENAQGKMKTFVEKLKKPKGKGYKTKRELVFFDMDPDNPSSQAVYDGLDEYYQGVIAKSPEFEVWQDAQLAQGDL